jgi:hypothetical protein
VPATPDPPGTLISPDEAKAVQKFSDFGTTAVTEAGNLARYVGRILGTVPEDAVGLVIGDPLHFVRTAIAAQYDSLLTRILRDRNVSPQPVSPSVAIPLIRAAYDEGRPELQELWANLIAAAMDPDRSKRVRRSFVDAVQRLDPLDAAVLKEVFDLLGTIPSPTLRQYLIPRLNADQRELDVSFQNLEAVKCLTPSGAPGQWIITSFGYQLVRACRP